MNVVPMLVTYIDHMGDDLRIANVARVSFDKWSEELSERDTKLIGYLAKHNHFTTFTHCVLTLRLKAPIFVARQLVKHQVGLTWNEVSRRYVSHDPEFYLPVHWRAKPEGSIKQGSGGPHPESYYLGELAQQVTENALDLYKGCIEKGFAPEQARMLLPLNTMTEWVWTGSLAAFARVCQLRLDPHAQEETQDIAKLISEIIAPLYPIAWKELMGE